MSHVKTPTLTKLTLYSAVTVAARLKALGVESVMAERNPRPGDNWASRYDCMRFHIPTSFCDLPYMCKHQQVPRVKKSGLTPC